MILCLWSPPPPLIKVASNTRPYLVEELWMKMKGRGGEGQSVLYITDVQLAAIWSKERPVFHRIVSTFLQLVVASPHKKMKKMLCSLLRNPCNVNFNKKRVNRSFLTKPFWSRWLAIGFILFCSWTLTSLSPYNQAKKKTPRIQPSWHTYTHTKWMRFWFRVVKSIRLPVKITTYLISIGWIFCLAFLYGWRFLNKISLDRPLTLQCAKKVVSDSPGLVDFAIGLVNSVLNLPDGQAKIFRRIKITKVA